ncbi:MAG TPA: thioredoxin family protein [Paracoccaceae bacterium]|nr:thioredoxin family protein [Paracoccaceae bacterium]HMO72781.1 thioredoxin family protein [Paracoccaceae bacterium]
MTRRLLLSLPVVILALAVLPARAAADLRLAMFELDGCPFCRAWNAEVGGAWPLSPEGQAAPLWRMNIRAPLPEGLALAEPVRVSPTFVLLRDGAEVGRITGYSDAGFFWGLASQMIEKAQADGGR